MVVVSGSANRYIGIRSTKVPAVMRSKIVAAPKNFPKTVCQFFRGRVRSNSIVRELYSPANNRIEITGHTIVNIIPMLWKVESIVATFVKNTLWLKKYPVPIKKTDTTKYAMGERK